MNQSIANLDKLLEYDSHTHFFGVGLSAVEYFINKDDTTLELPSSLMDQELIRGFGWSNNLNLDSFADLCNKHPQKLFCLSYIDGHRSFVSSNLISKLNFKPLTAEHLETGVILSEVERDRFYKLLPEHSGKDLEKMALASQEVFFKNNITKIRHLTGSFAHWTCLKKLERTTKLNLEIEVFFSEFMGQSLEEALNAIKLAQAENSKLVYAKGIKIFYDGSFGSNTAYTSSGKSSSSRISKEQLLEKMKFVLCEQRLPLAIHTIGDLALQDCLGIYRDLSSTDSDIPELHLEHAPIFTQESLNILKANKLKCIFHFQPSHWIADQLWYTKNRSLLKPHQIYPFTFLEDNSYQYFFGSDAPVVQPSKENTLKGLGLISKSRKTKSPN